MANIGTRAQRLFDTSTAAGKTGYELFEQVRDLPIVSPHGHVPAQWLAEDINFPNPTELLLTPDHYVTRILHSAGVDLAHLGVGAAPGSFSEDESREAFATLCRHWHLFAGTAMRYWMEVQLAEVFGIDQVPNADNWAEIYDTIDAALARPEMSARSLYQRFNIECLATTDDPCDDLGPHRSLAADSQWTGRVIPTFRPDRYLEPARPGWVDLVAALGKAAGVEVTDLDSFNSAMQDRRAYFQANGGVSTDHSHADARMEKLRPEVASDLFQRGLEGQLDPADGARLRRHLMYEQARMAASDGLVMTIHPAVARDHHHAYAQRFGHDIGADIPTPVDFVHALRPVLNDFGLNPNFRLVVFTMDQTVYNRELAPLAGFYPSVFVGAPWWFIDHPHAMLRWREDITAVAGFSKCSGFIDDTRAFLSIPARHDMARRMDCLYLGRLVATGQLTMPEAQHLAQDLTLSQPRRVFKL